MMEEWRDVKGYEGYYQVSNLGRVKSFERTDFMGRKYPEKILKCFTDKGYQRLCLTVKGIEVKKFIHRLIAEAFIDNHDNKPFINHKNGIRNDNRLENLEWVSARENVSHGANRKPTASKFIGVVKEKKKTPNHEKIWRAHIWIDKKQVKLGYFYTEEEAADAYKKALSDHGLTNKYAS